MTPDLKEYLNEVSEIEKSAHSRQDIPTLLKIVEVQAKAIDWYSDGLYPGDESYINEIELRCGKRAREAHQAVSDVLKEMGSG